MKLTQEHFTTYLPYNIQLSYKDSISNKVRKAFLTGVTSIDIETTYKRRIKGVSGDLISFEGNNNISDLNVKLHLQPISNLLKGDLDYLLNHHSTDWFSDTNNERLIKRHLECQTVHYFIEFLPYGLVQWLLKNHYDIYNLIERKLAINISTL